jgi:hypothetical protein
MINEVRGGCNPIGLNRTIDGDFVVVKKSELDRMTRYF